MAFAQFITIIGVTCGFVKIQSFRPHPRPPESETL